MVIFILQKKHEDFENERTVYTNTLDTNNMIDFLLPKFPRTMSNTNELIQKDTQTKAHEDKTLTMYFVRVYFGSKGTLFLLNE